MQQSVEPRCHFEELAPADLLSAVQSLPASPGEYLINEPVGNGFETFLRWAIADIQAAATEDSDDRKRYATNAIMNARRSFSCLVDQYLHRDGIALCKDAPHDASKKAEVLIERGVLDALASNVLKRAISKRNQVEHKYRCLPFEEAQDVVQVVRGTIDSITGKTPPYEGLCLFGGFLHGFSGGPSGLKFWFNGWSDPALMILSFDVDPWIGIIVPSSRTDAVVRRVRIRDVTVRQLLDVLTVLEDKCTLKGGRGSYIWLGTARAAGLLG